METETVTESVNKNGVIETQLAGMEIPGEKPEEKAVVKKPSSDIALDERGVITPKTSNEEWRVANMMLASRALPKCYQSAEQVLLAAQLLRSLGFDPAVAIRQTMIVNGSISIWGDLPKAAVERSGKLEFFDEFFFDEKYEKICFESKNLTAVQTGAVCRLKRNGCPIIERWFTVEDAKKAGLWGGDVWKKYPSRMLQMRARSLALKDAFPDVLSGVSISEYDEYKETKTNTAADELNQTYLDQP